MKDAVWHALPDWQGRCRFTVFEAAPMCGRRFLSVWNAWRQDPRRPGHLSFVSITRTASAPTAVAGTLDDPALAGLAEALVAAWPPATPGLHRMGFDGGRVELLWAFGGTAAWLRELDVPVDAFFLDASGTADAESWDARVLKALSRLAAPEATLVVRTGGRLFCEGLGGAGFIVQPAGDDSEADIVSARYRPVHAPRRAAGRARSPSFEARALIVGGGLAGTAAAAALAERGWRSSLLEAGPTLATGASGNPAGLFHGSFHLEDGVHSRFGRAAALAVVPVVAAAIVEHGVSGAVSGFLRLEPRLGLEAMQALLGRAGLPATYLEAVDADAASALAGLRLPNPAWHYPQGGWIDPAGLVAAYVARAGERLQARVGVAVASIRSVRGRWQAVDARGDAIDEAGTLILANAGDALRLLGDPPWPVERVRGQLSVSDRMPAGLEGCRLPVAGHGYLVPTPRGLVFGATRQHDDDDASVRGADHAWNLDRLQVLVGAPLDLDPAALGGRTAWRFASRDRLPLIGAVPAFGILRGERAIESRWSQPRHVPREPGVFVLTALGSRGIGGSALGAQVLAAIVCGTSVPLESGLVDAVDPARFVSRGARRAGAIPGTAV